MRWGCLRGPHGAVRARQAFSRRGRRTQRGSLQAPARAGCRLWAGSTAPAPAGRSHPLSRPHVLRRPLHHRQTQSLRRQWVGRSLCLLWPTQWQLCRKPRRRRCLRLWLQWPPQQQQGQGGRGLWQQQQQQRGFRSPLRRPCRRTSSTSRALSCSCSVSERRAGRQAGRQGGRGRREGGREIWRQERGREGGSQGGWCFAHFF